MAKEIYFDADSRMKLKNGIDKVADAVKITLGPKGRNAILARKYMSPMVTNDGATIANDIILDERYEDLGAQLIKEVAAKTNDAAGDGTTTAIVLAQAMVEEGMKNLSAGANPILLRRGIEKATTAAIAEIDAFAQPVQGAEEIRHVLYVSSEDEAISDLLSEALQKVNDENGIIIENSQTLKSYLDIQPGFVIDKGYISAHMINQPESGKCYYEDVDILLTDKKFTTTNDIYPILELALNRKKPLFLIVDTLEGEALQAVNLNNARGMISIVAVQGPTHGENRERELQDIEALVSGEAIIGVLSSAVGQITEAMLGHAEKIVVEKDKTTVVGGVCDDNKLQKRIASIHDEMKEYRSEFTTQVCQRRLSRLAGGTVVLKIGASTETDYQEKKLRVEDALHAARAAMESGVVVGGGTAYLRTLPALELLEAENDDIRTGINIVKQSLKKPLSQIAANAGQEAAVIVEKVLTLPFEQGYNALTNDYENLLTTGIIEPAKVVKAALQNAASMAMMALTVESMIIPKTLKKD